MNLRRLAVLPFLAVLAWPASAQQYPAKPVKFIVPYIAGSAPDVIARHVGVRLAETLGQPFVIENRGGAGGNIGTELLAKSPADGYTIGLGTSSSHAANSFLFKGLRFDPLKDFAPISLVGSTASLLVVPASLPVRDAKELVAYARARPGQLNYASGGSGSLAHLAAEAFRALAGISVVHVPFKGAPEIVQALLSENVSFGMPTFPTAYPQVRAGKLRALATTGGRRNPALPDVPTMAEAFPPGFELDAWFALFAPAGTPRAVVERLHAEVGRMTRDPAFLARFTADGTEPRSSASPEEFAAYLKSEQAKWERVIQLSGARQE